MHFVFASLMHSFFPLKNVFIVSILFWSSSSDFAKTIKSSAYMKTFIGSYSDSNMGESLAWFITWKISFTYRLTRSGLKGHPCLTPLVYLNKSVISSLTFTAHFVFLYISLYIYIFRPNFRSWSNNPTWQIESYAFFRSTKHAYSLFVPLVTYFFTTALSVKRWSAVL